MFKNLKALSKNEGTVTVSLPVAGSLSAGLILCSWLARGWHWQLVLAASLLPPQCHCKPGSPAGARRPARPPALAPPGPGTAGRPRTTITDDDHDDVWPRCRGARRRPSGDSGLPPGVRPGPGCYSGPAPGPRPRAGGQPGPPAPRRSAVGVGPTSHRPRRPRMGPIGDIRRRRLTGRHGGRRCGSTES